MTTRINTTLAAALLAVGVLVGAAGTIVVRDATTNGVTNGVTGYMGGMTASAGSMGNMAGMMTMMGAGGATGMMGAGGAAGMMGGGQMGPNASMTPGDHGAHHSPRGTVPSR